MRRPKFKSEVRKGDITTDTSEIQKIMQEYFENLYSNKLENQEEIEDLLIYMTH
jgi:hypothetical protein